MCELLNTTPKEEEIPIDRGDLNVDTQLVFLIYDKLQANWEGMSGHYLGKDLSLIPVLLEHYNFDKTLSNYTWEIIPIIDNIVAKDISEQIKRRSKATPTPGNEGKV
jgi:hypothetical protein